MTTADERVDALMDQVVSYGDACMSEQRQQYRAGHESQAGYPSYDLPAMVAEIEQSARTLLSASQEDAEHALRVMRLLDSGEWSLHRCMPHPSFTDEYNANSAWFVRREAAPFCDPAGNRNWSGRTAIAAFDAALAAMSAKETK